MTKKQEQSGLTLLELLLTLTLVGIVASIAVPSFSAIVESTRKTQILDVFKGAIRSAQQFAVETRNDVSVTPASFDPTTGDGWASGLLLRNNTGSTIARFDSFSVGEVKCGTVLCPGELKFSGNGELTVGSGDFFVCGAGITPLRLTLYVTGYIEVTEDNSGC